MSWTKRQFVQGALEELGLGESTYPQTDAQLTPSLYRLDAMMATWNSMGMRLGYPLPSSPELSGLDTETEVPDAANEAVLSNLALKIAPAYGKQVSIDTRRTARASYNSLSAWATTTPKQQIPAGVPKGAGNKPYRGYSQYIDATDPEIAAGGDGDIYL